jgi:heat shock protein HtpX
VRSRYVPDRGLGVRMVATMFLLGLLYVVLMAVLIYAGVNTILVLLLSGAVFFAQYYFSDRIALHAMGGRVVTPQEAPALHGIVDRLCALADMPKPQVAIADTDLPNAFATGRSPDRAVVCATTGLLRRLDARELEGVLSHELAHVAHRDVAVMTIASFVSVVAGLILRSMAWGGMGGRRRDNNAAAALLLVVAVSIAVYALSFLLIRVLSRYRELSADRSGALLTGQPSALASALTKLTGDMARIPTQDLRKAEAYNAFFFVPAFAKGFSISSLFATHPPLERRLEQLADISAQLGRAG